MIRARKDAVPDPGRRSHGKKSSLGRPVLYKRHSTQKKQETAAEVGGLQGFRVDEADG